MFYVNLYNEALPVQQSATAARTRTTAAAAPTCNLHLPTSNWLQSPLASLWHLAMCFSSARNVCRSALIYWLNACKNR